MPYLTDPIGDLLTRMRNAQKAGHLKTSAPLSTMKKRLCALLQKDGWIDSYAITGEAPQQEIEVTFIPGKNLTVKRVSKPGRRVYQGADELKPVLRGFGVSILTTSQGLMTNIEARKKKIGGEVLCEIY